MKIEFEFDYPMKRADFGTLVEYDGYKSRCRETQLGAQLVRLRDLEGLTRGEWARVLLQAAHDVCMEME